MIHKKILRPCALFCLFVISLGHRCVKEDIRGARVVSRQSTELRREPPQVQGPGQSRSICHQYVYIYICAKPHEMRMNLNGGDAMFLRNSLPVSGQKKRQLKKVLPP